MRLKESHYFFVIRGSPYFSHIKMTGSVDFYELLILAGEGFEIVSAEGDGYVFVYIAVRHEDRLGNLFTRFPGLDLKRIEVGNFGGLL